MEEPAQSNADNTTAQTETESDDTALTKASKEGDASLVPVATGGSTVITHNTAMTAAGTEGHDRELSQSKPGNLRREQDLMEMSTDVRDIYPEDDPQAVLAHLLSMGFELDLCEIAVAESVGREDSRSASSLHERQSLLEVAIGWIIATQGSGEDDPRSIRYSPVASPKPSRPPPPGMKPARGILKVTYSPPTLRASTSTSLFKRDWFSKQTLDQAAGALGMTFNKLRPNVKQNPPSSSAAVEPNASEDKVSSNSNAPPTFIISDNASSESLPDAPVRVGSVTSGFPSAPPSASQSATQSTSSLHDSHPSSLAKIPKHVRFSFPEITIDPEPDFFPDAEESYPPSPPSEEVEKVHETAEPEGHFHQAQRERARLAEGSLSRQSSLSGLADNGSAQFSAVELAQYYNEACVRRGEEPIERLRLHLQEAISAEKCLVQIDLSGVIIDRRNVASLADLLVIDFGLQRLNLQKCGLEDDTLKPILHAILSCNTLPWLNLSHNRKLNMNGIKYISVFVKKSKALKYLDLSGLIFDRRGLAYLGHALGQGCEQPPIGATLETLKMDDCGLRASHLEVLVSGLRKSRLTRLSLRNNRLGPDCGPILGEVLRKDPRARGAEKKGLVSLDFRGNQLKHGIMNVAQSLETNVRLRELSLRDNKLDSTGLCVLADALKYNRGLRSLDLSGNMICGDSDIDGIMALKDALATNKSLRELSLANTNLLSEATIALAETLPLTRALQRLDLAYNPLQIAGVMALSVSLRMNQSIISLEVTPMLDRNSSYQEDEDLARLLNDIVIYCQRNEEILKARKEDGQLVDDGENDEEEAERNVGGDGAAAQGGDVPRGVDLQTLEKEVSSAQETSTVLEEMLAALGTEGMKRNGSNDELLKQLYTEVKSVQGRLQQAVSDNVSINEELLGRVLATNDRLDATMKLYEAADSGQQAAADNAAPAMPPRRESQRETNPVEPVSTPVEHLTSASSPSTPSPSKPAPSTSSASADSSSTPSSENPPTLPAKDSLSNISNLDLLDLDGGDATGSMDGMDGGDQFMAELDDQMKEIDDFLNATAGPAKS
ncbi:hypothetical protein HK104_003114 [Borealophlyctis nickersoniae]|nr:hypothetical protein HK104_003114 [Borealophlyctis nickersoniae]